MIQFEPRSITQAINRIQELNSSISGDILNQAVSRALNRTASQSRTKANGQIRQVYNISASRINNELKVRNSSRRNLIASITASGSPLSLNSFGAKQEGSRGTTSFNARGVASSRLNRKSRSNAVKGVTATIRKGETINLPTAFIQVANGGITVFARGKYKGKGEGFEFGKDRMPIAKITTVSLPLMFINNDVMKPTENHALSILEGRITHEINWLLSK
jgi:hypothetical protein